MPIEALSYASLDYLKSFDLAAVAISPSGRVYVCRDPKGAVGAWWCKAAFADAIANAAWANADVPGAAAKLGLPITAHSVVAKRVADRTAKIDDAIRAAVDEGTLQRFNAEYRQRRLAAKRSGKAFMTYTEAQRRLRAVIARSVAHGGVIPPSFASVFDANPEKVTGKVRQPKK
jgi:hypothetical protein